MNIQLRMNNEYKINQKLLGRIDTKKIDFIF